MSPYRKLDETKGVSLIVKGDQHFERLAQLAGKIAVNLFAVLSRERWPQGVAHALPAFSVCLLRGSYEHTFPGQTVY